MNNRQELNIMKEQQIEEAQLVEHNDQPEITEERRAQVEQLISFRQQTALTNLLSIMSVGGSNELVKYSGYREVLTKLSEGEHLTPLGTHNLVTSLYRWRSVGAFQEQYTSTTIQPFVTDVLFELLLVQQDHQAQITSSLRDMRILLATAERNEDANIMLVDIASTEIVSRILNICITSGHIEHVGIVLSNEVSFGDENYKTQFIQLATLVAHILMSYYNSLSEQADAQLEAIKAAEAQKEEQEAKDDEEAKKKAKRSAAAKKAAETRKANKKAGKK